MALGELFMGRVLSFVVLMAALVAVIYLGLAILDGYFGTTLLPDELEPDSWSAPDSWSEWRDIMIVLMGFFWAISLLLLCVLIAVLIFLVIALRRILRENAVPAIDSAKAALDNVRGTAEFTGETVASPIIRVYSVVAGVRSGVGAIGNLPSRIRGRRKKGRF
ncbi:MAG: hypothetical protein ACRDHF_16295 [Tepidiformaceae bacterium]